MKGRALLTVSLVALLGGCRPATPLESPESLAADPARLDTVIRGCRDHEDDATPALCATAAEAARRQFMGQTTLYTPETVVVTARRPR